MAAGIRTIVLVFLLVSQAWGEPPRLAPSFVVEPPPLVQYVASAGARVRCAATGEPPPHITWLGDDGTPLQDSPGLRRIYSNGTLEMMAGGVSVGGPARVRCRAANVHGVALSRDVILQPVPDVNWEAVLRVEPAAEGGVAALTCSASADEGLVVPAIWYRGERVLNVHTPKPESRYVVAGSSLLIRGVSASDAGAYSCVARHSLTATTKRSPPAHLALTPPSPNSAPRLVATGGEVTVSAGQDFCLPCVASEYPAPQYTWYRESGGRLQPVDASPGTWLWGGGAALCFVRPSRHAAGAWLCKAYNVYGDATAQMRVHVRDALTVTVSPGVVVADTGSTVRFSCNASDPAARLAWMHDGAAAGAGGELVVRGVARAHRGLYQCFARRAHDSAQAAAELRLGDCAPELHYTFIEQALRPGGGVSLRCAASGAPPPRFTWLLDDQPLDQYRAQHRYLISEETSANGDVVSTLNMSTTSTGDGGRYTCRAHNRLGHAHHSARLNIYGPPSIRALGPVRVVAGANATVHCPYAGYPISSISWWRRGASVAVGGAGRVSARGAELRLAPALPADAGTYACAVAAPAGPAARRDIDIQVRNPPKISPFMFSSELTEGSSVQVLCGVSSGDKPMYFSWMKDGAPIPPNLQIEEKSLNEFSLLMFSDLSAAHSGEYTCQVANHAATVNYTATLNVKVAPVWATEPLDAAVLLGAPLLLECAAKGHPTPTITWYRRIEEGVSISGENSEQWEPVSDVQWGTPIGDASGVVRARNGSLTSGSALRAHQGLYRCTADNGVGPPLVKHVNVTIHEPAHFMDPGRNVSCVRGQAAALTCHAIGDSPLSIHWTRRGSRVDLDSYRWTASEVRTSDGLKSTLQLRSAERIHAGEYRCHAQNQYGRSELLMYLHVEEPPEAPKDLKLGGVGTRWVRLVWRATAGAGLHFSALYTALHSLPGTEPNSNTVNLTLESPADLRIESNVSRIWVARLEGLRPASAYSLRLAAANHVGRSPHSEPLLFTTLDEAPTASPQNVRVRPVTSGELHVSWSVPPQDSWNGDLLGYAVAWRELGSFSDEPEDESGSRAGSGTSPGWSSTEFTIANLRPFARYAVTLRAYNRAGAGPSSPIVYATTADGVPELPPGSVACESASAQSIRVRWAPPHTSHAHALRGYDLQYASLHLSSLWIGAAEIQTSRASVSGEATLQGLRPATNYSVWVRARVDRGLGPPSSPVYCTTGEDVPGAVEVIRAMAAGADAVRVTWLAPAQAAGRLTHYTLYTRELGKVGGEWSQRVEVEDPDAAEEIWREVRGLRDRTLYEFWVRAATAVGVGPPSRPVTAAPAPAFTARISSVGRVVHAARAGRARLHCAAVGAPPLRWRWTPLPPAHSLTDHGDMIIHKVELRSAGNYTCVVRNGGGSDAATFVLAVTRPPDAPTPRLVRADLHALHLAWDRPIDGGAALIGYSIWWSRDGAEGTAGAGGEVRSRWVPPGETVQELRGLACATPYRVTMRAHNALGESPHSAPLLAKTTGDKAKAPPGKELVWANSTCLRLNLLAWGGRCRVARWALAFRPREGGAWTDLPTDGESAQANNLRPGTWYELRVVARSPAADSAAHYRAATLTSDGERIGEPVEVAVEGARSMVEGGGAGRWRAGAAPALVAAALVALLAALTGAVLLRRRRVPWCVRGECATRGDEEGPRPQPLQHPHAQLYSTEPGKRNGKALTPPDGEMNEISPYATFSMSGGTGCALHLHTFGRGEPLDLAAPPPRPNLLAHAADLGRPRDSDSESSGSSCAACATDRYRGAPSHRPDALRAVESSAEDTSYSAGSRAPPARERGARPGARGRRRRDYARHPSGPTLRCGVGGATSGASGGARLPPHGTPLARPSASSLSLV